MKNLNFDFNSLIAEMRAGTTQEEIANSFATTLNEASALYSKELAKKKEEEAKRKEETAKKMELAEKVAEFYNTFYPEVFIGKASAKSIVEACDMVVKLPKNFFDNPLFHIFNL